MVELTQLIEVPIVELVFKHIVAVMVPGIGMELLVLMKVALGNR